MSRKFVHFLVLAALVAVTSVAMADPPARVGRVTLTEGRVTMLVNGEEEAGNLMNWPVTTDNHLTTAIGGRAEFRVGSTAIRLDGDSDIEVDQLDDEHLRLRLNYGSASVRLRDPGMLNDFELLTPQARVTLVEPGAFRIDTERSPDTTAVNVLSGTARVEGAGNMLNVRTGKRVEVRGDEIFSTLAQRDSFDDWAASRDRRDERPVATRYVPVEMTGYEDLDQYGNWVEDREYGTVWFPRAVPVGWAPYRDGRWVWVSPWGWTWVDNSPWGYAPFHYGRWIVVSGRWCWTPGRVVGRPVWSPALVGWVGGNNWNVRFNSGGAAPAVGWYPLTPRDRYVPPYRVSVEYERRLDWNHRTNEHWRERYPDRDHDGRRDGVTALPRIQFDRARQVTVSNVARVAPQDVRNAPQMPTPPQLTTVPPQPQRQQWQQNRDDRGNHDRGQDRRAERVQEQQRQPLLQTQPQAQQQPQPQLQVAPQRPIRTDNDERDNWRGRNFRDEPRTQQQRMEQQRVEQQQRAEQQRVEQQQRAEMQRVDQQQRLEQQRVQQQQRGEQQRIEQQQRMEQLRVDQQRMEQQQRMDQQRSQQQRAEQQRIEQQQRMDQQRAEQQRLAQQQRMEQQQREQQQREQQQRMEQQQRAEQQRAEQQRAEQQRMEQRQREERSRQAAQMQAAPPQQAQPQQQQRREEQTKRREERLDRHHDESQNERR
jgi:hypothetical protein